MKDSLKFIQSYLIITVIEGLLRTILIYLLLILIPAIVLMKPIVITRTFLDITIICIAASAFRMYIISPILITLAYIYSFFYTVITLNVGMLNYNLNVYTFEIFFSLDVSPLLFAIFAIIVVPMSLSAFYSYFMTQATGNIRRPPMPLTGTTIRDIILEILR
ncbi:MAG TPA: hypothetical protein VKU94_05680 [Geobacterales bacterium]|nr:hypothetical protein [Geobacterales bacterium]